MSSSLLLLLQVLLLSLFVAGEPWCLLWEDEFEGEHINADIWDFELGDGCSYGVNMCGWGNQEQQWYTNSASNAFLTNGTLAIRVLREAVNGGTHHYTSARMRTKNRKDWLYGKVEVRAKSPRGQGIWPAVWMLPTNSSLGGWPKSGEIDMMEIKGHQPATVFMTAHFGDAWNDKSEKGATYTLDSGDFSEDFHVYSVEWKEGSIEWFVDGTKHLTMTEDDVGHFVYPFREEFHLLLNVAVGGQFSGNVDNSTVFPQTMYVDYVKVYQSNC